MKLTFAAIAVLAAALPALGAPAADSEAGVAKRAEYTLRECAEVNWQTCSDRQFYPDDHNQLRSPTYNPENSFGPGEGIYCKLYAEDGTESDTITSPGMSNLGWWSTRIHQYKCWW